MHKIVVAITGASGSIYAKLLLDKLLLLKEQWSELSVVITENAKLVWKTELGSEPNDYTDSKYGIKFFSTNDFLAPYP
jgi:4-hydroxy-3-polyprenylbenzoate decarboxylase